MDEDIGSVAPEAAESLYNESTERVMSHVDFDPEDGCTHPLGSPRCEKCHDYVLAKIVKGTFDFHCGRCGHTVPQIAGVPGGGSPSPGPPLPTSFARGGRVDRTIGVRIVQIPVTTEMLIALDDQGSLWSALLSEGWVRAGDVTLPPWKPLALPRVPQRK